MYANKNAPVETEVARRDGPVASVGIEVQVVISFDAHVDNMPEVGSVIWPFSDTFMARSFDGARNVQFTWGAKSSELESKVPSFGITHLGATKSMINRVHPLRWMK